jgi:hypothetical protein
MDVVKTLDLDEKKGYGNVSQRVKSLTEKGVVFPELKKGTGTRPRISAEQIASLNALLVVDETKE